MRFGIGWRAPLGAAILANLDRIDVVEVMAEDFTRADRATRDALRFVAAHVPVILHATSLGLASSERVDAKSLDAVARVVEWLEPELWSEHLSFVRAAGFEIGHLAAPPRNAATLDALQRNVSIARGVIGSAPVLENVATLIEPPLCEYDEAEWMHVVSDVCETELLLDLHNIHANARNFGFDARDVVARVPHDRVRMIHLAGGRVIERARILDDHLHDVPDPVYGLLSIAGNDATTVILERDGNYPKIEVLLAELEKARTACHPERQRGISGTQATVHLPRVPRHARNDIDAFLATLYVDEAARTRFLANPLEESRARGFDDGTARELASIDADDLQLAARGFAKKRAAKSGTSIPR